MAQNPKVAQLFLGVFFFLNTLLACGTDNEKASQIDSSGGTTKPNQKPQENSGEEESLEANSILKETDSVIKREGYTATKYPVVLVHGMFGFDSIFGKADYFYKISPELRKGNTEVYIAKVSPLGSSEGRGEELLKQVEDILAKTGAKKVNLIGHSHGSPSSRYVAGVRPEIVASITSIAGANRGSPLADLIATVVPEKSIARIVISKVADLSTLLIDALDSNKDNEKDPHSLGTLDSLSSKGAEKFNKKFTNGMSPDCKSIEALAKDGIYYYSFGGDAGRTRIGDPIDILLEIGNDLFSGQKNDGAVSLCSSQLGHVIRNDYEMNHIDLVNGMFGLTAQDPIPLYRTQVNRLKKLGL